MAKTARVQDEPSTNHQKEVARTAEIRLSQHKAQKHKEIG
jgi:hypothetical protein